MWGCSGPLSVLLHRIGIPPESLAFLRPAFGALFFGVALLLPPRLRGEREDTPVHPIPPAILLGFLTVGGAMVGLGHLAFQLSTATLGVPAAVALLYLAPILVLLASASIFREPLTPARVALAALSVVGVWMVLLGAGELGGPLPRQGILWGLLSAVSYAAYTLFGKGTTSRYGVALPLFWITTGGALFLALGGPWLGIRILLPADLTAWGLVALLGALSITLPSLLLFEALRTISAGRASVATTVEPLVGSLLAATFLDQGLTGTGWGGMALVILGVAGTALLGEAAPDQREALPS
jgi:drug/metabolite transporter (DMT)-like permease